MYLIYIYIYIYASKCTLFLLFFIIIVSNHSLKKKLKQIGGYTFLLILEPINQTKLLTSTGRNSSSAEGTNSAKLSCRLRIS